MEDASVWFVVCTVLFVMALRVNPMHFGVLVGMTAVALVHLCPDADVPPPPAPEAVSAPTEFR